MTPERISRLDVLASQLADALMTAAICAQEIRGVVQVDKEMPTGHHHRSKDMVHGPTENKQRPLVDESMLSVIWNGKTLHLGPTLSFRLLKRLARRPNQYVSHLDLIRDVWDNDDLATATIRSQMRELRRKLRVGGMTDLASAIRGRNGRYILAL